MNLKMASLLPLKLLISVALFLSLLSTSFARDSKADDITDDGVDNGENLPPSKWIPLVYAIGVRLGFYQNGTYICSEFKTTISRTISRKGSLDSSSAFLEVIGLYGPTENKQYNRPLS